MKPLPISVCIVAGNEAARIRRTLESLRGWVAEIVLAVDNVVVDGTDTIAAEYGAKVCSQPWQGHGRHRNFASTQAAQPWLLAIDADEVVTPELRDEIIRLFEQNKFNPPCAAYSFPRCTFYNGRWIRHGDWYPDRKARLWKRQEARWGDTDLHESLIVNGVTGKLKNELLHYSMESLDHHLRKAIKHSEIYRRNHAQRSVGFGELWFRPWWRFVRGYFLRRGFLDGWQGYAVARLASLEVFLRYAKIREARTPPLEK